MLHLLVIRALQLRFLEREVHGTTGVTGHAYVCIAGVLQECCKGVVPQESRTMGGEMWDRQKRVRARQGGGEGGRTVVVKHT
jgi:hypothetical protein